MSTSSSTISSSTPSVLIVEDEPRLRELLSRAIGSWGFAVREARSGLEAIKSFAASKADIVLLDLNLPDMTGLEVFQKIRDVDKRTRVIILTGFADIASAKQAIHLDVTDFLTKPCHLGELELSLDRARRWLRQHDVGPSSTEPAIETDPENVATLESIERRHILTALERNQGNRTLTAQELGISRRTLQYRLAEYIEKGYLKE